MTTYVLSGAEAATGEAFRYVGIDADHRDEPEARESWTDSPRRFHDRGRDRERGRD